MKIWTEYVSVGYNQTGYEKFSGKITIFHEFQTKLISPTTWYQICKTKVIVSSITLGEVTLVVITENY